MRYLLFLVVLVSVGGCSNRGPRLTGKWRVVDANNRPADIEFFPNGKASVNSSELLDWKLVGRELNIVHPEWPGSPITLRVTFPDPQHLDLAVWDVHTHRQISSRQFDA